MKIIRMKPLTILVVVLLLGGILAGSALAAPGTPTPPANVYGGYGYGMMGGRDLDRVANLLGVTREDLISQLQQGKTLSQIAQGKGITDQQLIDTLAAPHKDALQLQVKYGYITQDQADSMVQQMTDRIKTAISTTWNTSNSGGFGGCGGFGGMMNGFGGMMGSFGGGYGGMMGGWRR